ncbi:hypothetical protein CONLIGDRAFT_643793 [Coniochaeta ligniaria NRRL 30616]|uniref:Glucan 4-alpha-glucosidase n=1 Tax=Coniochaeta ligniaria NRRL 30616 TaxID=1408157 RepID=A0A1J7IR92_9PEZI|nr:hypothetical protein CONLIGDRAFT_643793 [Coniochaeta ligniaria NRRL 30616]
MPPPKPPPDPASPNPRRASASKPSTPAANRRASANAGGATPKSAPAAAAGAAKKKPEPPSLLTDFILGRPSPQRVSAQRNPSQARRKSVALDAAGVREELRLEMRAAAVRKLQQPGGVRDRVKHWQKANATAMKTGVAMKPEVVEDVASEPTEILVQVDRESVTEEDRVRIKMRQKSRRRSSKPPAETGEAADEEGDGADAGGGPMKAAKREKGGVEIHQDPPSASKPKALPKKRIVSDEHWMKQRQGRKSPPRRNSPKVKVESSPSPLPKDFLARTAQNPTIQEKIKDWTQRVEIPDSPPPPKVKKYRTKGGDSITIEEEGSVDSGSASRPSRRSQPADDGIRVTPIKPRKPKEENDDGIRIKPVRVREVKEPPDDGIRGKPAEKSLPDDGIRIRPSPEIEADEVTVRPTSSRHRSQERSSKVPSRRRGHSPADTIGVTEEPQTEPETPTKKGSSTRRRAKRSDSPTTVTQTQTEDSTEITSRISKSDDESDMGTSQLLSDLPSIAPGSKSLADIPVGYSAFSELDLPLGADARNSTRRPKTQRNSSLKAVPKVLKKVVSAIAHEKVVDNAPPRTGINKPPSIENWLNTTVDPFVDTAQPKKTSVEKEWVNETRKRSSSEAPAEAANRSRSTERREEQENADPAKDVDSGATPKKSKTPTGSGLKRKGATRSTSSPLKPGQRKPFKEQLMDAFRGESGGHKIIPPVYSSYEARPEPVEDSEQSDSERYEPRRNSGGSTGRSRSPDPASTVDSSSSIGPLPQDSGFPRRKPPTNGFHELSTIVSEASCSTHQSDTVSTVSQSTITQSTALTKATDISRGGSHKSHSGLKRRLTKHSDLVSVLSLPDNGQLHAPIRTRSVRSGGRLLRKTSKILDNTPIEDLLEEFVDDEHYYQRELKTLVDGVVPVLLKQVVNVQGRTANDLFGPSNPLAERAMSKAVVEMGISLEKLRSFHRRVPLSDVQLLLAWLENVYPVYDRYLDVWRLGFQDLIVNLAPAAGKSAEEDSLVNALPRNEDGDALDEHGEPVDVAHLLKRPLVRIKWMAKLIRGAHKIQPTPQLEELLSQYEKLQDKARRRHREETARKTDEDANNTDVTRTRDLRSLSAIDAVVIDPSRQVNAKDAFSLDLKHSSGQRLECRVEVIFRDNVNTPTDKGDILVRETGAGGRSWLLFPPIPKNQISARKGDNDRELTVMIRGYHNYRDWYELLTLSTDDEDQIADWLDILGSDPMPPTLRAHLDSRARLASAASSPRASEADIPVGERKLRKQPPGSPAAEPKTPSRYHKRNPSVPTTPTTPTQTDYVSPSPNKTPTQNSFSKAPRDDRLSLPSAERGSPLREGMRPDPSKLTKTPPSPAPYREDGAPPPPAHRTLSKSPPVLPPPVDIGISRIKRRGSSPLKHEYQPSDVSSESSVTASDESDLSDSDSSSDELDESDVPDILPAISIKEKIPTPADSVISDSSLTPSASASQAGVAGGQKSPAEWSVKAIASISYWSNRHGTWKDVDQEACSIVITPGLVEAFPLAHADHKLSRGLSDAVLSDRDGGAPRPLIALDLTPLVMIRMSNSIDLEIRSPVRPYSILNKIEGAFFRFRSPSAREGGLLYDAVHVSRMNNAKFRALEEEARFRSFGQHQQTGGGRTPENNSGDGSTSSNNKRRSWFGRKNSYRASARAPPSESQGSSSGVSASSFLKRLTGGGNTSFNIDKSTVDKQSRPGSVAGGATTVTGSGSGGGSGPGSLYTSSASSSGGGTLFRAPSLSIADSGKGGIGPGDRMPIRLYNAVPNKKWEDYGNCILQILRPPPGMHQELKVYHGMEKRIKITSPAKKEGEADLIVLDVVLGSGCFNRLGTKGVVVKVWEDIRDKDGNVGFAPAQGGLSGKMKTWCFQTKTNAEAAWVVSLLTQEVELG